VFSRGLFSGVLGDEATLPSPESAELAKLREQTEMILKKLEDDARKRQFALAIAAASALFAAVKLGIIAFHPAVRRTRAGSL
jgi:hypothetical protein